MTSSDWFARLVPMEPPGPPIGRYFSLHDLLVLPDEANYRDCNRVSVLGRRNPKSADSMPGPGDFVSPIVSRNHCRILVTPEGHLYLVDLGSLHGTFVSFETPEENAPNRLEKWSPVRLYHGDSIILGKSVSTQGVIHQPLSLTVHYRVPQLGESGADEARRSLGLIAADKAPVLFASGSNVSRLKTALEDVHVSEIEVTEIMSSVVRFFENPVNEDKVGNKEKENQPPVSPINVEATSLYSISSPEDHTHRETESDLLSLVSLESTKSSPTAEERHTLLLFDSQDAQQSAEEHDHTTWSYGIPQSILYPSEGEDDTDQNPLPRGTEQPATPQEDSNVELNPVDLNDNNSSPSPLSPSQMVPASLAVTHDDIEWESQIPTLEHQSGGTTGSFENSPINPPVGDREDTCQRQRDRSPSLDIVFTGERICTPFSHQSSPTRPQEDEIICLTIKRKPEQEDDEEDGEDQGDDDHEESDDEEKDEVRSEDSDEEYYEDSDEATDGENDEEENDLASGYDDEGEGKGEGIEDGVVFEIDTTEIQTTDAVAGVSSTVTFEAVPPPSAPLLISESDYVDVTDVLTSPIKEQYITVNEASPGSEESPPVTSPASNSTLKRKRSLSAIDCMPDGNGMSGSPSKRPATEEAKTQCRSVIGSVSRTLGWVMLGAAVGSVGTIAGLLQLAE